MGKDVNFSKISGESSFTDHGYENSESEIETINNSMEGEARVTPYKNKDEKFYTVTASTEESILNIESNSSQNTKADQKTQMNSLELILLAVLAAIFFSFGSSLNSLFSS